MVIRADKGPLYWQSKVILLLVMPWTVASVLLQAHWWLGEVPVVAWTVLGISGLFGLIVWRLRAGTLAAAAAGAAITASLMFATTRYPYQWSWLHGGLMPLLAVFLLTFAATKIGKAKKERLGTGENRKGRNAAQVVANLGVAGLAASLFSALSSNALLQNSFESIGAFAALVALGEAAADTVSSELGQVFGGTPRLITTLRRVEKGTDGGVTVLGTLAGALAALVVVTIGFWAFHGSRGLLGYWISICIGTGGSVFGLLFDSLLGATLERKGWLNNDAVNFLSTLSAVVFTIVMVGLLAFIIRPV
jgi:uncharacterized protein (TIGR00297 family)